MSKQKCSLVQIFYIIVIIEQMLMQFSCLHVVDIVGSDWQMWANYHVLIITGDPLLRPFSD